MTISFLDHFCYASKSNEEGFDLSFLAESIALFLSFSAS